MNLIVGGLELLILLCSVVSEACPEELLEVSAKPLELPYPALSTAGHRVPVTHHFDM